MNDWVTDHPEAVVVLALLWFGAIWTSVSFGIAKLGGWRLLAQRFRFDGMFTGTVWRWQSGAFRRIASYNGALIIGANESGIMLTTMFFFRLGHPALFIPWSEITVQERISLFGTLVDLKLGLVEQVPFTIRQELGVKLRNAAGSAWPKGVMQRDTLQAPPPVA